jgi:hypothetical protein
MTLRINAGTAPVKTPEASNLPPSVLVPFRTDSLGSYAKAEQHEGGFCATLFNGIWSCGSCLLRGICNCFKMLCGCKQEPIKLPKPVLVITPYPQNIPRREITSKEIFNAAYHDVQDIHDLLQKYNMAKGRFPTLDMKGLSPEGAFNCIIGVNTFPEKEELFPQLVKCVLEKVRDGESAKFLLSLEGRLGSNPLAHPHTLAICRFMHHLILALLQNMWLSKSESVKETLGVLNACNPTLFSAVVHEELFLASLTAGEKGKATLQQAVNETAIGNFLQKTRILSEGDWAVQDLYVFLERNKECLDQLFAVVQPGRGIVNCIQGINRLTNKKEVFLELVDCLCKRISCFDDIARFFHFKKCIDEKSHTEALLGFIEACIFWTVDSEEEVHSTGLLDIFSQDYPELFKAVTSALFFVVVKGEKGLTLQGQEKFKEWAEKNNKDVYNTIFWQTF